MGNDLPLTRCMPNDLDEFLNGRLETCRKAFEVGNLAALYDAVKFCLINRKEFPEWVGLGMLDHLEMILTDNFPKNKGRSAKWKDRYRNSQIELYRAETVLECREHGIAWKNVFEVAAMLLDGTFAKGDEHAIRKSYKNYLKCNSPFKYYTSKYVKLEGQDVTFGPRPKLWEYIKSLSKEREEKS